MKKKFILSFALLFSIFLIGCRVKEVKQEVLVIDEAAKERINKEKDLEINLIYRIENESKEGQDNISTTYEIFEDKVYEFTKKAIRMKNQNCIEGYEIISLKVAHLDILGKEAFLRESLEDISVKDLEFKDLNIYGDLLMGSNRIMIRKEGKIYYLNEEDELKEIKEYENLDKKIIDKILYQENIRNKDINLIDISYLKVNGEGIELEGNFDSVEKVLIDYKNNRYVELKKIDLDDEFSRSGYKVIDWIDDKIYVSTVRQKAHEIELVIGYIENNIFHEIFEDKAITIIEPNINYNHAHGNKAQIVGDNIIFAGIVNDVNGIWIYNMENKNLSLEMELEEGVTTSFYLNEGNEFLYINNQKFKDELLIKTSDSIANLDKDLKINQIINIFNDDLNLDYGRYFYGISQNGREIYYSYSKDEKNYFEVYKIME